MNRQEANGTSLRRVWGQGAMGLVALAALGLAAPACLDRPVAPQQPITKSISTKLYKNQKVDKIDLLFMIDNSASMADKQKILASAVPDLVARLTNPVCVDRTTRKTVGEADPGVECSTLYPNSEREFDPIDDIHIGVITSSLGGHGANSCSKTSPGANEHEADMAHLITRGKDASGVVGEVETYQGMGFLNWDPTGKKGCGDPARLGDPDCPPGESKVETLTDRFTNMVRGADQDGCGFEANLEAWHRFLVDPEPYKEMIAVPCNETDTNNLCRAKDGIDDVVLQQRKDFLRKDSLLAIIMLTDENDCSVKDERQSYVVLQAATDYYVARGTNACLTDPWDADCKSCYEVTPEAYPECNASGLPGGWDNPKLDDQLNLRCYEQKRRFGMDFLYPIRRYIDALTEAKFDDGTLNPVFCSEFKDETRMECASVLRDSSLVFLAGIVGVPWQDLAVDPNDMKQGYRPSEQLTWTPERFADNDMTPPTGLPPGKTLWNMILGEVDENAGTDGNNDGLIVGAEKNPRFGAIVPTVDPIDPLMKESVDPRTGTHPITGVELVQPGSGNPVGHVVNSSEWTITARNDLQYACVFELDQPIDCSLPENINGCDCNAGPENPLCWDEQTSDYGTLQYRAKAYPGRRQLAVLKGMESQAIVASVCPANMNDAAADDFGYRPAIGAIVDRLKTALAGTCWDKELAIAADGTVACVVLEATKGEENGEEVICPVCDRGDGVRIDATAQQKGVLGTDPIFIENGLNCVCQINQTPPGAALDACVSDLNEPPGVAGWCYVDPSQNPDHSADIVASCPPGNKRLIRFVGTDIPVAGSLTFLQCVGANLGESSGGSGTGAAGSTGAAGAGN